jgi:dCMP deaminase
MKQKFIDAHMKAAEVYAQLSSAKRLQVGCVVVKDNTIIGIGYNGMPVGWDNDCEYKEYMSFDAGGWLSPKEIYEQWPFEETIVIANDNESFETEARYCLKTKPEVLHAETNSLAKIARSTNSSEGAALFVTHAPCLDCAKIIHQAGINSVYYRNTYRSTEGVDFLEKCNINVKQV